ncbi:MULTISPECIES: hypothetical protein [Pontibacillus]|uniref:Uncharacterized protein n=1 Tax=Pontibacillus chungwhensis TaxID=265426 RepID=A0ABY8UWV7_9BACI|nr:MULTISPECIES: hypothetical protein [Pontibacillus]MCD5325234.1 hypothetical protein [Pontibacillus sp. HN14]WIF97482.1 hypothetical protein QNI29_17360 [Pontibacillus chungwhensis]
MKVMQWLKRIAGWGILILSFITGLTIVINEGQTIGMKIIQYVFFSALPVSLGFLLAKGRERLKDSWFMYLRVYTFVTLLFPAYMFIIEYGFIDYKAALKTSNDIHFDTNSAQWIISVKILLLSGLAILFSVLYIKGFKSLKGYEIGLFFLLFVLNPFVMFLTKDDYRAIRDEQIVFSQFGNKEIIGWDEVEKAELDPYVSGGIGEGSEESFKWEFSFQTKNGKVYTFDNFYYNERDVKQSFQLQKKIDQEGIQLTIVMLDENEWEQLNSEDRDDSSLRDQFYDLIFYDPVQDEYSI